MPVQVSSGCRILHGRHFRGTEYTLINQSVNQSIINQSFNQFSLIKLDKISATAQNDQDSKERANMNYSVLHFINEKKIYRYYGTFESLQRGKIYTG